MSSINDFSDIDEYVAEDFVDVTDKDRVKLYAI